MATWFSRIANRVATWSGSYKAFVGAAAIILIWAATGPFFAFSNTWQLVINTGTTVVTFLMVFLIQNTQNHDARALHLKLDELIRAIEEADDDIIRAEEDTDDELAQLKAHYHKLSEDHAAIKAELARALRADRGQ
ncbi:MAG: low affinity iron permease family protein [Thermomicrobiales bacterium]